MKFIKQNFLIIPLLLLTISCDDNLNDVSNEETQNNNVYSKSPGYDQLGIIHNDMMDIIDESLKKDLDSLARASYTGDGETVSPDDIDEEVIFNYLKPKIDNYLNNVSIEIDDNQIQNFPLFNYNEYKNVMRDNTELGIYQSCNLDIECVSEIYNSLDPNEDNYVTNKTIGSIYYYSLEHWDNYEPNSIDPDEYDWISVAIMDARGAWSGATYGGFVGVAGSIAGGLAFGMFASAMDMVKQNVFSRIQDEISSWFD